jgi:hypothetical protein
LIGKASMTQPAARRISRRAAGFSCPAARDNAVEAVNFTITQKFLTFSSTLDGRWPSS